MRCKECGRVIPVSTNGICVICWDKDDYAEMIHEKAKNLRKDFPYTRRWRRRNEMSN